MKLFSSPPPRGELRRGHTFPTTPIHIRLFAMIRFSAPQSLSTIDSFSQHATLTPARMTTQNFIFPLFTFGFPQAGWFRR